MASKILQNNFKKTNLISAVQLINKINNPQGYFQILFNGGLEMIIKLEEWSGIDYEYYTDTIGMMFSSFYISISSKKNFLSLNDFIDSTRFFIDKKLTNEKLNLYPTPVGRKISKEYFDELLKGFNETFFENEDMYLEFSKLTINYNNGFVFFNSASIKLIGCETTEHYLSFTHEPYI